MVRRRRGRPLSCVFVADVGSWAVLSAMRAAVTMMWAVRTAAWTAGWCFGGGLTFPSPTKAGTRPAGTVPPVLRSRGRRRIWRAACRRRWASWRAVSEFSSPAPGGRLGRPAARGRTRNLGRGWVCTRRRGRRSQKTCAARTKGGGGWYPTLGLICRRRLRAVGLSAAFSNGVVGSVSDPYSLTGACFHHRSPSSLYGPGDGFWDGERRRLSWSDFSRRRPPETALTVAS
jgi:hypothetical protein